MIHKWLLEAIDAQKTNTKGDKTLKVFTAFPNKSRCKAISSAEKK